MNPMDDPHNYTVAYFLYFYNSASTISIFGNVVKGLLSEAVLDFSIKLILIFIS
jgi:hypothetical protein